MIGISPNTLILPVRAPFLKSAGMRLAIERFEAVVKADAGVIIAGEAGTGRELMARALHRAAASGGCPVEELLRETASVHSGDRPFIAVDCASSELENALFGLTTGSRSELADFDSIGIESRLRRAVGGTLFLRQLHDMPTRHQIRLARVLRDGEVWVREGAAPAALMPVQTRVIATVDPAADGATDHGITQELRKRFYGGAIQLPPLRERREDMPALVKHLLGDMSASMNLPTKTASRQAIALLAALPWRGNLRELRGLLRALIARVPGPLVRLSDVLENIRLDGAAVAFAGGGTLKEARERFEREYVTAILQQHRGRMAEAAKALGIQRTNLYRKVRQLSVQRRPGQ